VAPVVLLQQPSDQLGASSWVHHVLRITCSTTGRVPTLRLEGHLEASKLAELAAATPPPGTRFVIDLSSLQSADPDGVCTLAKLVEEGAVLQGASPYIAQLLVAHERVREDTGDE